MPTESDSTSPTPQSNSNAERNGGSKLSATSTYDPTPYVQRARVTRPAPPKPSVNPLQFVQIKPCSLYQSAQEHLKKADEVKKVKEIKKEEPEDWQSNLDNWKSSRRKRVEHIIDRVVEVKKLELEEHDRTRRKSKTFSEMLEERGPARRKLSTLAVYTEEESNDLSDLGIGTSSASGKSSLSEDCDNQSVMSDNIDTEKPAYDIDNNSNHRNYGSSRDYISSPGYDTSTSTAPASSPDPCEYTYEGAIQDYKTRISRAQSGYYNNNCLRSTVSSPFSKDSTPERSTTETFTARRTSGSKIEDRLINFEIKCTTENPSENTNPKKNLPKVDILKRRELFEKDSTASTDVSNQKRFSGDFGSSKSIRDRLTSLEKKNDETKKQNRLSGDITSIKDRLQHLEKQPPTPAEKPPKIDVPVVSLKDRLTSLQSAASKEEIKKPVALVDEHDLEVLRREELEKQNTLKRDTFDDENINSSQEILNIQDESNADTDREDSGIHTTDVSCSVSQTDEQPELVNEETHHHINEDGLCTNAMEQAEEEVVCITTTVPDLVQDSSVEKTKLTVKRRSVESELSEDQQLSPGGSPEPPVDQEASVNEALELALQAIDGESFTNNFQINEPQPTIDSVEKCEKSSSAQKPTVKSDAIYENLKEDYSKDTHLEEPSEPAPITQTITEITNPSEDEEPYYQVPKSSEPYYEVPKHTKPVPVYENVEIFYSGPASNNGLSMGSSVLEPPKEKPPPPPVGELTDDEEGNDDLYEPIKQRSTKTKSKQDPAIIDVSKDNNNRPIKRMNSTKRIKKELRNKRSSFLGLEGSNDDDSFLELTIAPPPDMAQLLQEEKRMEKQLYMKAGLYDSSDTGDSRDSGVSENHSRQSSEPFTTSSEEHEDLLGKKEKEIIEVLEKEEERRRSNENWNGISDNDSKIQKIEYQIREQEEVLRVERELLQLEQEELKRQRENLIIRENMARRELEHGAKMLMSANRHSLLDINTSTNHYANVPNQIYQVEADYRKSMSDLQEDFNQKRAPPPAPPAKPLRTHQSVDGRQSSGLVKIAHHARLQHSQSTDDFAPTRNYQPVSAIHHGNMTRHTLHALSATPKPKFTDGWVHSRTVVEKTNDSWLSYQQKRKSVPEGFNYNKHWLIQEAEQRRLDQQRGLRSSALNGWGSSNAIQRNGIADNKPLPDAVIQTLTQRVQSKGIGERKKLETSSSESTISTTPTSTPSMNTIPMNSTLPEGQQDKILSVSGKKKCSHCGEELGRGAAMIIESLRLFYHINCFKCCVCHVQLGDGLNGTDVRVRNHKLHCHNCYSSDDGIKFSCV